MEGRKAKLKNNQNRPFSFPIAPLGDSAVILQVGDRIDEETHRKVSVLSSALEENPFPGLVEVVPAFTTVTVYYDPAAIRDSRKKQIYSFTGASPYRLVCSFLQQVIEHLDLSAPPEPRTVEIPVLYGGEWGPDLEYVADYNGLTPEQVIQIHTQPDYLVYMIGFAPGFPYLGGMSEKIAAPRRSSPRLSIPAGSVGIAGGQTGIYPISTPGGWRLIGRTPLSLFRPGENPPSLLRAGDRVRFKAISPEEYMDWKEETT